VVLEFMGPSAKKKKLHNVKEYRKINRKRKARKKLEEKKRKESCPASEVRRRRQRWEESRLDDKESI
jgi:hypothetical protein